MIIIGSAYEHDCIDRYIDIHVKSLEELEGQLTSHLNEDKYVFWMYVNNLTGKIFPVKEIGELCKKYNAYYICDATAAIAHTKIEPNIDQWCSCLFASSHKWHGPKGNGFMWISEELATHLLLSKNPKDEYGMLWGTADIPGICAMTEALKNTISYTQTNLAHYQFLTNYLYISAETNGVTITEHVTNGSPAIHAITVPFVNADALQAYLASKDIYVGLGHSACSDEADYRVLEAQGYTKEQSESTIRVSFCEDTEYKDIDELITNIKAFKEKF